jgi:hypothetical protein
MSEDQTPGQDQLVDLIFDCALRACADVLFEVVLEMEKYGDPTIMKMKESIIQALRNRVMGPGFLSGIGSNLPK